MTLLVAKHLTKCYPPIQKGVSGLRSFWDKLRGQECRVTALDDLSLEIQEGEIFGLLGPNGAGKTTLCKILNALVIPTSGYVSLWGKDSIKDHAYLARNMVTIFGGESDLFGLFEPRLSCESNLKFVGDLWGLTRTTTQWRLEEAFEILELGPYRHEWYQKLSAGTRQKMFLAVPFILRRPLVILDEPTIRLDVSTRNRVQQTLREILNRRQGTTVLLATHDMNEAERLCDRIGIIDQGRLLLVDTPHGLRRRARAGRCLRVRLEFPMTRDDAKRLALVQTALTGFDPPPTLSRNSELDAKLQDGLQSFTIGISKTGNEADSGHLILAILQSLASVGLPPKQITVEEPSLEEAFMDVIGQAQCRPKPEEFKEDALDAVQQISNRFFPW